MNRLTYQHMSTSYYKYEHVKEYIFESRKNPINSPADANAVDNNQKYFDKSKLYLN